MAARPLEIVESGYDAVADRYAALEHPEREWPRMRWLRELLAGVEPGSRVLDLGCGNGLPVARAMAARYDTVGVDISGAQIKRARRNVTGARFIQSDLCGVELDGGFAAIAAFYVIEHVPRDQHAAIFRRLHGWLRPGGRLLFTIEPDDQPGVVGQWLGEPMFFSQFSAERALELVAEAGLEVMETSRESQLEGDREVEYLWVLARRRQA